MSGAEVSATHGDGPAPVGLGTKVEAVAWMTRLQDLSLPNFLVAAAWLARDEPTLRLLAMLLMVASLTSALTILNDVLDEPADRATHTFLPLPAGLISRREAWVGIVVLLLASLTALVVSTGGEWRPVLVVIGMVVATGATITLYSMTKGSLLCGLISPTLVFPLSVTGAWAAYGPGFPVTSSLLLLLGYALVRGTSHVITFMLRDVDSDPTAGVHTFAVRVGAARAFLIASALSIAAAALVVGQAVAHGRAVALALALAGALATAATIPVLLPRFVEVDRGRVRRTRDLGLFRAGRLLGDTALVAVHSVPVALLVLGVMELIRFVLRRGYDARIMDGGLVRASERRRGLPLTGASVAGHPPSENAIL